MPASGTKLFTISTAPVAPASPANQVKVSLAKPPVMVSFPMPPTTCTLFPAMKLVSTAERLSLVQAPSTMFVAWLPARSFKALLVPGSTYLTCNEAEVDKELKLKLMEKAFSEMGRLQVLLPLALPLWYAATLAGVVVVVLSGIRGSTIEAVKPETLKRSKFEAAASSSLKLSTNLFNPELPL